MKLHKFLPAILLVTAALMFAAVGYSATPRSTKGTGSTAKGRTGCMCPIT